MRPAPAIKRLGCFGRKTSWALLALVLIAGSETLSATTRTVTKLEDTNDGVCNTDCSLREAIATAAVGDTIDFAITGTITLQTGELGIARSLDIVNSGAGYVGITTQGHSRIFSVTSGTVTITNLSLDDAAAQGTDNGAGSGDGGAGEGGAVYVGPSGTLTMTRCRLQGNTATGGRAGSSNGIGARGGAGNGGAVANRGHLTLRNCYLTGNTATGGLGKDYGGGLGNGGAVFNGGNGVLVMSGCTLYGNRAVGGTQGSGPYPGDAQGAGFANGNKYDDADQGTFTITNCTFWGNEVFGASTSTGSYGGQARGGAVYAYRRNLSSGSIVLGSLTNCTLAFNDAIGGTNKDHVVIAYAGGGGLSAERGNVQLSNTLIAENSVNSNGGTDTPDVEGDSIQSQGYNFIGNGAGPLSSTWASTDNVGTASTPLDPQFNPNPAPESLTPVLRLKYSSAAIDAGNSPLTTDQLGARRPVDQAGVPNAPGGNGSDIGAVEMRGPTTFVVTNTNDSGAGSLRQALIAANDEGQPDSIVFNIPTSDPGYDSASQSYTIQLTSGELAITNPVNIDGGNAHIAVTRSNTAAPFRFFNVTASGVTLANLFMHHGAAVGSVGPGIPGFGGAVLNGGGLTLLNCTLLYNSATGGAGQPQTYAGLPGYRGGDGLGGAVLNEGTLVMTNCTLAYNSVQGGAGGPNYANGGGGDGGNGKGGALFSDRGTVTVTNCTFRQNSAHGAPGGAGNGGYGATGLGYGGALFSSADAALRNSILSGDTADVDPEYSGSVSSTSGNLIAGDAKLFQDYSYNGGSTPTFALLAGSPAIDAGDDSYAPPIDQRGYPRVGRSDIGAFEFGATAPVPTPTPTPVPTATPIPTATPTPSATPTPPSQLQNLSTRKQVGSGDNVLIGGFIVVGTEDKKVLLRGLGPSLPVSGALADPILELHAADTTLLAANDNWRDASNADEIAAILPPGNDLESAILTSLTAKPASEGGAGYTAVLAGQGGAGGIGLLEIYDLATAANSKLANISTRGSVGTTDDLLIGGFIPGPSDRLPLKVLMRALGPSLPVSGALQDPVLELHDGQGATIVANDNWHDASNANEIAGILPPGDDRESAILTTVAPANSGYTAVVRGANGSTGVALVEVYALQ